MNISQLLAKQVAYKLKTAYVQPALHALQVHIMKQLHVRLGQTFFKTESALHAVFATHPHTGHHYALAQPTLSALHVLFAIHPHNIKLLHAKQVVWSLKTGFVQLVQFVIQHNMLLLIVRLVVQPLLKTEFVQTVLQCALQGLSIN